MTDHTAIDAGFDFRRYAMTIPAKPKIIIVHMEGFGDAGDGGTIFDQAQPGETIAITGDGNRRDGANAIDTEEDKFIRPECGDGTCVYETCSPRGPL